MKGVKGTAIKRLCGEWSHHDMQTVPGGWKECIRCGVLSSRGVPELVRFWRKIERKGKDECWPWLGATRKGYGAFMWRGRVRSATSIVWELAYGPLKYTRYNTPETQCICHKCDNPICCNPKHLFLGSLGDNLKDMTRKGRKGGTVLTPELVKQIRKMFASGRPNGEIAQIIGVDRHKVYMVTSGRTWTCVG